MNPTSKRTHAHFNIYIKQTNCETFIYIRKARQFSRNKTVFITVLFTKSQTHHATRFFMKTLKWACICKEKEWKYMLHDVYIDINPDTSRKARQFALRFYIQKAWHFVFSDLSWKFWYWRRKGGTFINKKNALSVKF